MQKETKQKRLVAIVNESSVRCLHQQCPSYGYYDSCYMHTYLLENCWRSFYDGLDETQKELVLHPEEFYLGD